MKPLTPLFWSLVLSMALCGCKDVLLPPEIPPNQLDPALAQVVRVAREKAVAKPDSSEAWGKLGQAFDAADFGPQSIQCYDRAINLDPTSARWHHLLGLRRLREEPELALQNLAEATRLANPTQDAPRIRLAQALIERGRFVEATNQLTPLLSINPAHPAARLEAGRANLSLGNATAAIQWLTPAATNPYTARPALLLLSQAAARMTNSEMAARFARGAATLPKPFDWPDPFLKEVQSLRQDRNRIAEQANALLQQRRVVEAENIVSNLLVQIPNDPEGLLLLGRIRIQQRNCSEAETTLRRLIQIQPDSLNGLIQLGMSLYCQSRWTDAAASFERAIALKPDFAQAHFNLGLSKSKAGEKSAAIQCFKAALRCNPGDVNTHATLAEELLQVGELEQARAHVANALSLDPNHAKARAIQIRLSGNR
jgi:tetratricopeptide (TPR) repeat protein